MHGRPQPAPERLSRLLAARLAAMAACRQLPRGSPSVMHQLARAGTRIWSGRGARWHVERLSGMGWPQGAETVGQLGAGRVRTYVGEVAG